MYTTSLALASITTRFSDVVTRHVNLLMLVTLAMYAYRDLWQLATYDQKPLDASEGWLVWVEISIVAVTGAVLPLFAPRRYVPVDPTVGIIIIPNLSPTDVLWDRNQKTHRALSKLPLWRL